MPEQQKTFDFSRAEQLYMLQKCRLPTVAGVSATLLKAVLRAIDDHARFDGWCFASQQTIADEIGCVRRQVCRAIVALRKFKYLIEERRSRGGSERINHTRIAWNDVLNCCADEERSKVLKQGDSRVTSPPTAQGDMVAGQGDMVAGQGDMVAGQGDLQVTLTDLSALNRPQPSDDVADAWRGVVEEFRKRVKTIAHIADGARSRGEPPEAFRKRVVEAFATAEHPENRRKFKDLDACVAYFLATESWPTNDVRSLEDLNRDLFRDRVRKLYTVEAKPVAEIYERAVSFGNSPEFIRDTWPRDIPAPAAFVEPTAALTSANPIFNLLGRCPGGVR